MRIYIIYYLRYHNKLDTCMCPRVGKRNEKKKSEQNVCMCDITLTNTNVKAGSKSL